MMTSGLGMVPLLEKYTDVTTLNCLLLVNNLKIFACSDWPEMLRAVECEVV